MAVNREADVLCPAASIPAPRPQPIRDRQSTAASLSAASPGPGALAPRHGPLRANPAGAGPGRGGLRAARPPGAVARRRPLVAGLRNTRGSRVSGPHVAVHASGGHHYPGFDRRYPFAARHPGRVRLLYYIMGRVLPVWAVVYSLSVWWMIWSPTEEMTYQAYALPRIQALSGRTWVAMVVVGFWWALQHSLLPFLPDWRSALWRRLSRHPVSRLRALHRAAKLPPASGRERPHVPLQGPERGGGNLDDWSRGLLLAAHVGRNLAANQPGGQYALDVRNIRTLGARGEGRSRSAGARASRAADAVNEVLRNLRRIVVHDVRDAFHVNAALRNVGRPQDTIVAVLEAAERLGALVLAAVAMDGRGLYAVAREFLREAVCAVFGAGEYQKRT